MDMRCTRPAGFGRAEGVGQYLTELIRSSNRCTELGYRLHLPVINARDQGAGDRNLEQRVHGYADKAAVTTDQAVPLLLVTSASNAALSDAGTVVSRFAIHFPFFCRQEGVRVLIP